MVKTAAGDCVPMAERPPHLLARVALQRPGFRLEMAIRLERPGVAALHGPSGCGKTSFLRVLAGLEPQAEGLVQVGDRCWQDSDRSLWVPPWRRAVGFVFQENRLFPHLSVGENLRFGARQRGLPPRGEAFDRVVALLGLGPLLDRHPTTLSGGEQRRVAIGRALLTRPRLLLLDEPLAGVDADRRDEILPHLQRLVAETRMPMVLVTHDWAEVLRLSDQLYLMADGRVVDHGPTLELQYRLDGCRLNALDARVQGWHEADRLALLWVGDDLVRVPASAPPRQSRVRVLVSPLEIAVSRAPVTASSILNVLRCRLQSLTDLPDGRTRLDLAGRGWRLQAIITQASVRRLELKPGVELHALIKSVVIDWGG